MTWWSKARIAWRRGWIQAEQAKRNRRDAERRLEERKRWLRSQVVNK